MASSTAAEVANNFCYPDHHSAAAAHFVGHIPAGYDPIFSNMTQNVDMIGFGMKNGLVGVNHDSGNWQENKLFVDDSSIRCVFPCEGNERPSQGLSLSLSSADPSSIGLQQFELRPANNNQQDHHHEMRDHHHQQHASTFGKSPALQGQVGQLQLRSSKYLGPVQELLNEFCSLETNITKQQGNTDQTPTKPKTQRANKQWEDINNGGNLSSSSNPKNQSLSSLEFLELQKRKTKLLSLLEEVDRRYRHYCDQMKAVVSSFEAVAGHGAAKVYSALASRAMSRHFRCLRDGIVGQIKETKKAMGEKDLVTPGTSRGETPRLKVIDQALRQQRALQQMSMMESHPWRPQRGLPERSVSVLRAWLFEHFLHPYPSDVDKHILARQTGLSRSQARPHPSNPTSCVSNWFINARVRLWKPMVEEMYLEETKEQDNMGSSDGATDLEDGTARQSNQNPHGAPGALQPRLEDQKPTVGQLVRIDSECLSSIITSPDKSDHHHPSRSARSNNLQDQHGHSILQHGFGRVGDGFGAMELDFSSYDHHSTGGGVSLTLGLQQHGGSGGVSLAFSPTSQSSLFYPRDHMEDCQPVQYSLLDSEGQNLPYRNLMGAQLLHDLAG
ncbi:hypothetical protein CDL15_Pgr017954 [Punica granatum]|uniref:Homeobox domain-containing protein n=1 Tax=Punica granatum TaxID=22663 RepID=A0A218WIL7_PUNGR|nr:hypothetical protein CDL15_Pgr017954 [Punica granatum]